MEELARTAHESLECGSGKDHGVFNPSIKLTKVHAITIRHTAIIFQIPSTKKANDIKQASVKRFSHLKNLFISSPNSANHAAVTRTSLKSESSTPDYQERPGPPGRKDSSISAYIPAGSNPIRNTAHQA
jgi:hypothetical protein